MAHPYNNKSPFNCWKGYERVPGTKKGAKGSCRKSSPANQNMKFEKANRERYEAMSQKTKDSLHHQDNLYGNHFLVLNIKLMLILKMEYYLIVQYIVTILN